MSKFSTIKLVRLWDCLKLLEVMSDVNRGDSLQFNNRKFTHALIRNKKRLEEMGAAWDADRKPPEWVKEFRDEVAKLRRELGEASPDLTDAVDDLKAAYKAQIDAADKRSADLQNEWEEGEEEFTPFMVKIDQVPDCIAMKQMYDLMPIIDDSSSSEE